MKPKLIPAVFLMIVCLLNACSAAEPAIESSESEILTEMMAAPAEKPGKGNSEATMLGETIESEGSMEQPVEADPEPPGNLPLPSIDDEKELSEIQRSYSLKELTDYFGEASAPAESLFSYADCHYLTLDQVNTAFPIDILRSGAYAVYRVAEGGYFFVFFDWILSEDDLDRFDPMESPWGKWEEKPIYAVHYYKYLTSLPEPKDFSSIIVGKSTGQDVLDMDCCTAFFLALSSCSYSLTLLNDGNLMQIIYAEQNPSEAENYYERLIVESVEVMDPSAPVNESEIFNYAEGAFLSGILSKDIEAVNCITD